MAKKTSKLVLLDTNILIDLLRGENRELSEVTYLGYGKIAICTVSILEIFYGMFKKEEKETKACLKLFNKLHLDKEISLKAIEIMLAYPNNRPTLPDCLIAATSIVCNA